MSEPFGAEDKLARLRLIRSDNVGAVTFRHLLARFGTAVAAIEALPDLAARGGGRPPRIAGKPAAEQEMATVGRLGATHLFFGDSAYPRLLAQQEAPPPVIIAKGRLDLLQRPAVAIVGARNASAAGCRLARQFAAGLGAAGIVVVSGLARGIDSAAHDGSIETGTVAVVAGGIDIFYPPENEGRQRAIGEKGVLIAEHPPGFEPRAQHFPRRNRIIAGLANGTVVMEAAPRSGSLITARLAGEYGRDVMAVPGSPLDPRAQGCNQLIREGAILVQNCEDILEALQPFDVSGLAEPRDDYAGGSPAEPAEEERQSITDLLSPTPVHVDEIIRQSLIAPAVVQAVLLELELAGRLQRHAGGRVSFVG